MPFDFGTEPANFGETTTISCLVAKGDLPLDMFWSLNAIPVVQGHHSVSVMRLNARTSVLSVDSLDAQHRGVYKCMARNGAGQSEHHSALEVNGYVQFIKLYNFSSISLQLFCVHIFTLHPFPNSIKFRRKSCRLTLAPNLLTSAK